MREPGRMEARKDHLPPDSVTVPSKSDWKGAMAAMVDSLLTLLGLRVYQRLMHHAGVKWHSKVRISGPVRRNMSYFYHA